MPPADFEQYGFQWQDNLIMDYIGGSTAHGAKVGGTDDTDWYGVYIEPPEKIIGIDRSEHFVYTTGGKPGGNGAADVDVCLYSLQKWANLAAKGNPSSLHFLFAPKHFKTPAWIRIELKRNAFLSKNHVRPFLGFADDQMKRLFGEKGQKNIHRAADEAKYGYDTKYAMHVIRLYGEAQELMETGQITLPRPDKDKLIDIRLGKYKLSEIREWGRHLENEALRASDKSPLPDRIDRDAISKIIASEYRIFWGQQEGL